MIIAIYTMCAISGFFFFDSRNPYQTGDSRTNRIFLAMLAAGESVQVVSAEAEREAVWLTDEGYIFSDGTELLIEAQS